MPAMMSWVFQPLFSFVITNPRWRVRDLFFLGCHPYCSRRLTTEN